MPGDDADFEAYLAARWPFLVRSLVLTGLSQAQAEDVTVAGLARCRAAWSRMREVDDVDAQVYGTVYDGRPRAVAPAPPVLPESPTEADDLRHDLEVQLGGLTPEQREAVVLRYVGGLDEVQVADVLDTSIASVARSVVDGLALLEPPSLRSEDTFRRAAGAIDVPAAPYERVVGRARQQRRRRWRTGGAVVAVAAVVIGGATWLTTRPEPGPATPAPEVVASRNPVDISWYDGRVHLREVAVTLPGLTSMAGVGESVAFIDTDGGVGIVRPDGQVAMVGHAAPGATILGSADNGWAAWIDPDAEGSQIVVWSLGNSEEIGRLVVTPDTRLIALDQDRVYATAHEGTYAWQPALAEPEKLHGPTLADVGSATRVYQHGRRIEMVQPFFSVSFTRPGEGAIVSPGGNFVLTRRPGSSSVVGAPYVPLIYDTRSGDRVPSGIARDEVVVDAAFGDNHQVDYLVANVADLQGVDLDGARSRLYVLRTCELESHRCSDVVPVRSAGDRAMFAP